MSGDNIATINTLIILNTRSPQGVRKQVRDTREEEKGEQRGTRKGDIRGVKINPARHKSVQELRGNGRGGGGTLRAIYVVPTAQYLDE